MTDETTALSGHDDSSSALWRKALSILSEREGSVLTLRHGAFGGESLSFSEIGEQLGISRQRAHQLYEVALERLVGNEELRALVPAIAGPKLATKVASATPRPSAKREEPEAARTSEEPSAKRGPGRPMDPQETERRLAALARVSAGEISLEDAAEELGLRLEALRGWLAYRRKIGASGGIPADLAKVASRRTKSVSLRPAPSRKLKPLARTRREVEAESAASPSAKGAQASAAASKGELPKGVAMPKGSPPKGVAMPMGAPPKGVAMPMGAPPKGVAMPMGAPPKGVALRRAAAKSAATASAGIDALLGQLEGLQRFHAGVEARVRELLEFIEREMPR